MAVHDRCAILKTLDFRYCAPFLFAVPIDSIEDGLDENDWDNWVKLTEKIGDRMAKYNQLIRIEEELGDTAAYGYKRLK